MESRTGDCVLRTRYCPEDGTLATSTLTWSLIMHHCSTAGTCHEHVIQNYTAVAGGTFSAPDHEYPSHLELRLTASDSAGRTAITRVLLDPRTVPLTFESDPPGLRVAIGAESLVGQKTLPAIVGSNISIGAASPQVVGATTYSFVSWSDGGAQTHNVIAGPSTRRRIL